MNELRGIRVLLVEDDVLVSMLIEDMLTEMGCQIVGPAERVVKALALVAHEEIDFALLDRNIAGNDVDPVAAKLAERGVPFAFVTGYQAKHRSAPYQDRPSVQKPVQKTALERIIITTLIGRRNDD